MLILSGSVLMGIAVAMAVVYAYRYFTFPEGITGLVQVVTLQFLPRELRFVGVLVLGLACMVIGLSRLSMSLVSPFLPSGSSNRELANILAEHRFGLRQDRINVVAIGGGTGLSSLLRGLKKHDINITAIVTVADDGGSTGRIRHEFDIPAPGDLRNCLTALADDESLVSKLFQYRFDQPGSQLNGHSFGNLFITALTRVTGSFEQAVIETANVLNIRGRVLPSTLANVHLAAELDDGAIIHGESSIGHRESPIKRMFLEPAQSPVYEPAFGALLNADLIILGPGSLYTSVMPNLLVDGISQAVRWSPARVVYVCNVATQPGETDHFTAADHVRVVLDQLGPNVVDIVLVNSNPAAADAIEPGEGIDPVLPDGLDMPADGPRVVSRDVISDRNPLRHDPGKLSAVLLELARLPLESRPGSNVIPFEIPSRRETTNPPLAASGQ